MSWQPIETAPFQTVIEVRNPVMDGPCLATRGYCHNGMVHPDNTFCTSVFTPDPKGFFPFPAGKLVCPTEWRPAEQSALNMGGEGCDHEWVSGGEGAWPICDHCGERAPDDYGEPCYEDDHS